VLSKKTHKKVIDVVRAYNEVKNSHMHHDLDPKKFSRRLWFEETLHRLDVKNGLKKKIDLQKLEKYYWDYLIPRMKLFPNTIKVLESLKNSGKYKIACLTDSDGDRNIKVARLKYFDVEKYFDYIITTDDTGKNKPSIENWEYLIKISGIPGRECMMIGDHPEVDLINAKKMGLVTVWTKEHIPVEVHFKYVDYEIKDIGELLSILKEY
jgi:putative hydrolase of the HAD superfamily